MDGGAILWAQALADIIYKLVWFCCGWFLGYVILGVWVKVRLARPKITEGVQQAKRFGPVLVAHALFSAALVNPWIVLWLDWRLNDIVIIESAGGLVVICILYFGLLPLGLELFLFRVAARWRWLKWLQWAPPLRRAILASVIVSALGFGAGCGAVYLADVIQKAM